MIHKFLAESHDVLRGKTGALILSLFISGFGLGMAALSLPLFLAHRGASPAEIGLTLSMFGAGMLAFELLWGWVADRYGVPGPLIASRLLSAAALFGFAFASAVPHLAILYLLSSGMLVAAAPLGRSFLALSLPPTKRGLALGFYSAQRNLGTAIGAVLAGFTIDRFGIDQVFRVMFVFPLVSAVIAAVAFRGQYHLKLSHIVFDRRRATDLAHRFPAFWPVVITSSVVALMLVGFSGERAFLPILATGKAQLSATDAGLLMSILGLTGGTLMIPSGKLSDRYGRRPIMLIGLSLSVAGLLIYSIANVFHALLIATIVRGIGLAFAWPVVTALLADTAPPARQGLTMGIHGEFENVGQMAGPIVAGLALAAGGIEIAFVCLAGVVLVGFALTLVFVNERRWLQGIRA